MFFKTLIRCGVQASQEKSLQSPLDSKKIKPVDPKGNQPWTFIGRTDAEADASTLWSPDAKSWLTGKDPDARKDWRQEERETENEMVGWHHQFNGYEWTWVKSGRWRGTGSPWVLQSMGSQGVGQDWATKQQRASLCGGFPCLGAWTRGTWASTVAAGSLSSCGTQV